MISFFRVTLLIDVVILVFRKDLKLASMQERIKEIQKEMELIKVIFISIHTIFSRQLSSERERGQ